jgi:antibiotic biosynthesis monooxygenase (ABM) superfamily enzyme
MTQQSEHRATTGEAPERVGGDVAVPEPAPVVPPPPIHVRAVLTWMAIFPLVLVIETVFGPLVQPLHPLLRTLILTLIMVPTAVYLVVPNFLKLHARLRKR